MTDVIDAASEREEGWREAGLKAQQQRAREVERPDEDERGRYCLGCGEMIPSPRLVARPDAVRCIECQGLKEERERRGI